jgi:hypothetical protein
MFRNVDRAVPKKVTIVFMENFHVEVNSGGLWDIFNVYIVEHTR